MAGLTLSSMRGVGPCSMRGAERVLFMAHSSTVKPLPRSLNRAARRARSSSHIHTVSGRGAWSEAVECVDVRAPNRGMVVEADAEAYSPGSGRTVRI